jgi:hypothetical protein
LVKGVDQFFDPIPNRKEPRSIPNQKTGNHKCMMNQFLGISPSVYKQADQTAEAHLSIPP